MRRATPMTDLLDRIPPDRPVLIAGPTASGKSALALRIAERQGGVIVNADASQVYDCWRVLTARPTAEEESRAPHALYGHVAYDAPYSAGHWLREVAGYLRGNTRPIIVGGTGLYFSALTTGLAEIPATPPAIRAEADALPLARMRRDLAAETAARIDLRNRARVQRAWEVQMATGRALHAWQDDTGPALLPPDRATRFVIDAPRDWLTPRIEARFAAMLDAGALDEARAMRDRYDPALPSCRAIGVPETMALLEGRLDRADAIAAATIATRRYAKRQRTWFRNRMSDWPRIMAAELGRSG